MGTTSLNKANPTWKPGSEDAKDMQGYVISPYSDLNEANYLLLSFAPASNDSPNPKGWLLDLCGRITDATGPQHPCINLALSASGLRQIYANDKNAKIDDLLNTFSRPFREGMSVPDRARFLGDDLRSHGQPPETWEWRDTNVHAVLMLYAVDSRTLDALVTAERRQLTAFGLTEIRALPQTVYCDPKGLRREHFGFADGFSQPNLIDGEAIPVGRRGIHDIPAGEVILGQKNTYNDTAEGPMVPSSSIAAKHLKPANVEGFHDLGRNGTYLVLRKLKQNVAAFWQGMEAAAKNLVDENRQPATGEWLAAKVIGRTLDGDLLVPDGCHTGRTADGPDNDLLFFNTDRAGFGCPVGAHIRRANPRDGLAPTKSDCDDIVQAVNRHRIMRRGRPYGPRIQDRLKDDGQERGLIFACLNSEIDRQFEFVQHTWVLNQMFGGLFNETDPMLGPEGKFTVPSSPVRQKPDVQTYVTVHGGGYFFIPSLGAIRYLGES